MLANLMNLAKMANLTKLRHSIGFGECDKYGDILSNCKIYAN